ncbi:MAG TPA: hypothetical protein VM619_14815 [Luteimonas sp.]|nr:hypothetical protein [Luteimonas sp.]
MFDLLANIAIGLTLIVAGAAAVTLSPPLYRLATKVRSRLRFGNPAWIQVRLGTIVGHGDDVPPDGRYELVPSTGEDA